MRKYILGLILIHLSLNGTGQESEKNFSGKVSYVSSQNIYVKFSSTAGISAGDTLYSQSVKGLIPVLEVKNLSSTSCICSSLAVTVFSTGDIIIARIKPIADKENKDITENIPKNITLTEVISDSSEKRVISDELKQKIRGSLSLNSYLDFSNTGANNSQRFRYTFSLDAKNIGNSKFSFETYLSFKHKAGEWQDIKDNVFNGLKIYNMAVKYDLDKTTQIRLGRMINQKLSNIGAMDGLQVEKSVNRFAFGGLVGFRPDYKSYGFNVKLLQFGAYAAFNTRNTTSYSETSIAFMEQMNDSKTDRRFVYFQHSNNIIKNLNFFSTFEADLYQLKYDSSGVGHPQNTFCLTGLYASLNYRPGRNLSLSCSYDARKNIMYYETYKTFFERILESELRQGLRLQASYRLTRELRLGLQTGYRYLKSDPHPSRNIYGYLTYSQIPVINISATVSVTVLESAYINGNIYSLNLTREFFRGKLQSTIGYRYVDYRLPENSLDLLQNIGDASLTCQIFNKVSLSVSYEGTIEQKNQYHRAYLQLRKRF